MMISDVRITHNNFLKLSVIRDFIIYFTIHFYELLIIFI